MPKTKIVFYMTKEQADQHSGAWNLGELSQLGDVQYLPSSTVTLGAETGEVEEIVQQFRACSAC